MLIQNILEVQEINKKSLQSGWKTKRDFVTPHNKQVTEFNNLITIKTGLVEINGATSSWNINSPYF